jgi:hypothetical protein
MMRMLLPNRTWVVSASIIGVVILTVRLVYLNNAHRQFQGKPLVLLAEGVAFKNVREQSAFLYPIRIYNPNGSGRIKRDASRSPFKFKKT